MPRYFFNFVGDTPAHDVLGRDFADQTEAIARGRELAQHLVTEKPHLARDGNAIVVVTEDGQEIKKILLT
ncbi:hypothetical protein QRQ56_31030 [Bradyrhizobium sp. U531]|uniref:DUF6894 family protein n=1 Tax=Bradyrhizobium sp. U531 TaxID=3053458 RepID=UPI003F41C3A3